MECKIDDEFVKDLSSGAAILRDIAARATRFAEEAEDMAVRLDDLSTRITSSQEDDDTDDRAFFDN